MYVWFDETAEPKDGWPNRVNDGTQFFCPFRVPLELEQEFILWASRAPGSDKIPDWAWAFHWQVKPDAATSSKYPSWKEFHMAGIELTERLERLVHGRVNVMYERPQEDASADTPRRLLVKVCE
jgi:hypothetical protein